MQQWGVNYWETYAPVVNWISVRFLLILGEIAGLESRAIDFVLAFPQADLDVPVYMELPHGMEVADGNGHLLLLRKSLYGLKQASANWHELLKKALALRGFKESVADPCVFIKSDVQHTAVANKLQELKTVPSNGIPQGAGNASPSENAIARFRDEVSNVIVLVYVDDCIILGRDNISIDRFIQTLTQGPEKFAFTDEGSIDKYLGVNIERLPDNNGFTVSQPHLIQRILEAAHIDLRMTNSRPTPVVGPLLSRDEEGPARKHDWKYRTLTGMLEYLQITSRPDISMATHQYVQGSMPIQSCAMNEQSSEYASTCLVLWTRALYIALTQRKDSSVMLMLILLVDGLLASHQIQKYFYLGQDLLFHTLGVLYFGVASYNLRLLLVRLKLSILHFRWR